MTQHTARIVLGQLASGSARIVMGDAGEAPAQPQVLVAGNAQFPALGVRAGVLRYRSAAARPVVGQAASPWQVAAAREPHGVAAGHQDSPALPSGTQSAWQDAAPLSAHIAHPLPQVLQSAPLALRAAHQDAAPLYARTGFAHQQAQRLRAMVRGSFADGIPTEMATGFAHQDGIKTHRHIASHWQVARALGILRQAAHQKAMLWVLRRGARYQDGVPPPPGISPRPTDPPDPGPCYDPATLARIVLDGAAAIDARIVLVCLRAGPGPGPERPHYVIPRLTLYMTTHSISARLLPSMEPVTLLDATIDTDDGSWCWGLQASGPEHLLDQLAPGAGGLPARVLVTIDGIEWIFAIERLARTRRFGQHRCAVQGRSVTALLSDDYLPQQSWHNASAQMTAQQAINQALEFSGTTLDWGVTDWLLPAGTWSHTGAPLSAALRVAESIGAVVRSHRTLQELQIAPRYAIEPWDWARATPDVTMPADVIVTDSLEPDNSPAYNAVYVSGQAQGIRAHAVRKGTAGELLAPAVVDGLITHADAARQRATSILGAAGLKQRHSLDMPLLTGSTHPGLLLPGYLLHVDDIGGKSWRGLVRGISVRAGVPTVRQSISVERRELV